MGGTLHQIGLMVLQTLPNADEAHSRWIDEWGGTGLICEADTENATKIWKRKTKTNQNTCYEAKYLEMIETDFSDWEGPAVSVFYPFKYTNATSNPIHELYFKRKVLHRIGSVYVSQQTK